MSPRNDVAAAAMNGVQLVASWLTPAVLFCVLNLMIGTIFFRSSLKPPQSEQQSKDEQPPSPRLVRVSSFLERVKSFNLTSYRTPQTDEAALEQEEPHHVARSKSDAVANTFHLSSYQSPQPEPAAREQEELHHMSKSDSVAKAFNLPSYQFPQPEPAAREQEEPHHVARSKSDAVAKAAPAARGLQKSASEKMLKEKEEDEDRRRPATVRDRTEGEDEEVDEKADDFINKFRQQLKLQRMDSILRYHEMLNRGSGRGR